MDNRLIGRWRSYKHVDKGQTTDNDTLLLKIDADGTVHYASLFLGKWETDTVKRRVNVIKGQHYISERSPNTYILPVIEQDEMQFATTKVFDAPLDVYYLRRVEGS